MLNVELPRQNPKHRPRSQSSVASGWAPELGLVTCVLATWLRSLVLWFDDERSRPRQHLGSTSEYQRALCQTPSLCAASGEAIRTNRSKVGLIGLVVWQPLGQRSCNERVWADTQATDLPLLTNHIVNQPHTLKHTSQQNTTQLSQLAHYRAVNR
jgi:hypothetical protein